MGILLAQAAYLKRSGGSAMISSNKRYRIVLVTCASVAEARKIGRSAVEKKLAACANVVTGIESIYRWKGRVERAQEVLVLVKTTVMRLRELERELKRVHSYEVPEFIVLPIVAGSREYLKWVKENTR
jgi:periplasmic divalent cation tolerance protein